MEDILSKTKDIIFVFTNDNMEFMKKFFGLDKPLKKDDEPKS